MLDLRKEKILDLTSSKCFKDEATYLFIDELTEKKLIAKFIARYNDENDKYLIMEFKKIASLSAEPEIATVYFMASGNYGAGPRSCYIMDFIEGKTLRAVIDNASNLEASFICEIIQQLASGMEKAHHYEISHGDLHEENIMINNFGYVKIIDFLWWDFKLPFEKNSEEDINSFKLIVDELAHKLDESETDKFEIQHRYLKNVQSFRHVAKNISIINRISNDLALIDEHSIKILARIILSMIPEANLMYVLQEKSVKIPEHYIPELTEKEKKFAEGEKKGIGIKYFDTRGSTIQENLNRVFNLKLHQLRQAGLIDWQMGVENTGENFVGPYVLHFQIFFTYKLFEWKRLNQEFNFLDEPKGKSLVDLILENDGFQ